MYDDANSATRRTHAAETVAGANGVGAKFANYQAFKLIAVHAIVTVAGTSAGAGNAAIIKNGTTAVATCTLGTVAAGGTVSLTVNSAVPSLTQLTCTNGTDATGKALILYEYQLSPDALLS